MSFIVTTYVSEGIVMASDSRQTATLTAHHENAQHEVNATRFDTTTSDNCYKLFLLEDQDIGVGVFGETILGNAPVEHAVRLFMEEYNSPDDDVLDVVEKMMRYFSARYPEADTAFHMCGYKIVDNVSVPYVYHCQVSRNEIRRLNVKPETDEIINGCAWGGQGDVIARLIRPDVTVSASPGGPEVPNAPILWDTLAVQDAIDFAEFAVWSTIQTIRFQARPKNVGGPIDVLLITPHGSGWIRRKDYFPDHNMPF